MTLFGKHRVRATFYHIVAIIFVIQTIFWIMGFMSDKASFIVTAILFVLDYIAEMYDPHPDNPGSWYTHFHRVTDHVKEDICELTRYAIESERRAEAAFVKFLSKFHH